MAELILDGATLDIDRLEQAARGLAPVRMVPEGLARMAASRALVDRAVATGTPVYGVTTGLGARAGDALDADTLAGFSLRTLRGRAHASGELAAPAAVRAAMIVRLNTFLTGHSGARPEVARHLEAVLNAGLVPVAGRIGSVGGGDLVLNATVALALTGEGEMARPEDGTTGPAVEMMSAAGLAPLEMAPRDGLALANHTGFSAAGAALALAAAGRAHDAAFAAAALIMEGFRANLTPLDPRALAAKPLPGQARAAAALTTLLEGSGLWEPGAARRLQDPLSLRNAAQIHGGVSAALAAARDIVEIELNGSSDNPVALIESGEMISCGAYHTTELALAVEGVARAWVHLTMMQVARISKMMDPRFTDLPLFLARPGSDSNGFAPVLKVVEDLAAEIGHAAAPAPVWPSISANGVEDALTSVMTSVRGLERIAALSFHLTAIEMMVAAQATDLRGVAARLGPRMAALQAAIRQHAAPLEDDRPLRQEIDALVAALASGAVLPAP